MLDQIFPKGYWANTDEFVVPCPYCPGGDHPTHSHCFLNPVKEVYHCFRCGASGGLRTLLRDVGVDESIIENMKQGAPVVMPRSELIKFDFGRIGTSGLFSERRAIDYLSKRGLDEDDFVKYDIRYTNQGKFGGRVIIPIYESNRLVCFVARAVFNYLYPKYLYPRRGETMLTAGEAIFGYEGYSEKKVLLVEGVFDAISARKKLGTDQFNIMAILGKSLSNYQMAKLWRLPTTAFYVMLDQDARTDTINLAVKLLRARRSEKVKVHVCFISAKDPAEASGIELLRALNEGEVEFDDLIAGKLLLEFSHV